LSEREKRLLAELELVRAEAELSAAKGTGKTPKPVDRELKDKVRAMRQAFRAKYREQVNVNPASLGAGATVSDTNTGTG